MTKNFLSRESSLNTEEKFMKVSHILAVNVSKNFLSWEISQDTEDQLMRKSNMLVDNVANNLLNRVILKNI